MFPNRVWLEVNAKKIQANILKIKSYTGSKKLTLVLKANAYGIGIELLLDILKDIKVDAIAVAEYKNALKVKDAGFKTFILGALIEKELEGVVRNNIISPIGDLETAKKINTIASELDLKVDCQLKIDSGMGRLGFLVDSNESLFEELLCLKHINFMGIYSHFPNAYSDTEFSIAQINKFKNLISRLNTLGFNFDWIHIANSDGIQNIDLSYKEPFNMVRAGINLYGLFDNEGKVSINLENALSLKTQIIQLRELPINHSIGYGRTYILNKAKKIATLPIGYADGLSAMQSNKGVLYVNGYPCPIVGKISMDFTTIDVDNVPDVKIGDEVICFNNNHNVNEFASSSGVSTYEMLTSLGERVKRIIT